MFKYSKTKTEAIKDCENDPVGEYAMRKLFNNHDDGYININYHVLFLDLPYNEIVKEHPVKNCNY